MHEAINVGGAVILIHPPLIIARSPRLALATPVKGLEYGVPVDVKGIVARALETGEIDPRGEADPLIAAWTILHGGVMLFYLSGEEVTPLSRLYLRGGFRVSGECGESRLLDDYTVLEAWRALYWGRVSDALGLLGGCAYSPPLKLTFDASMETPPVGFETLV